MKKEPKKVFLDKNMQAIMSQNLEMKYLKTSNRNKKLLNVKSELDLPKMTIVNTPSYLEGKKKRIDNYSEINKTRSISKASS